MLDTINGGLPHNTFLTILARTGLIGLPLFVFAWGYALVKLFNSLRSNRRDASKLATFNILLTMLGFSNFVLFFERPMHGVSFWILCALAIALVQYEDDTAKSPTP